MPSILWVALVVGAGIALVLGASRATGSVNRGPVFVRWMLLVFAAFVALASIPIFAA